MTNSTSPSSAPLGLDAFGTLRAEDEAWLPTCMVPPRELGRLTNNRSVVVFGGVGAGKSALYRLLRQRNRSAKEGEKRLLVDWQITPSFDEGKEDLVGVLRQTTRLLDLCAAQLAAHITESPQPFTNAPSWVYDRVVWFIRSYLRGEQEKRLAPLLFSRKLGSELLRELLGASVPEILYADAPPDQVLNELCMALQTLGINGIWVMADDLERQRTIDEEALRDDLVALLGTLPLFEQAEFAFKLFVPARLEAAVSSASGTSRRRIDAVRLRWRESELLQMVNLRLQIATGNKDFTLPLLCKSSKLLDWLRFAGADSPRHWLDQVKPLLEHYLFHELDSPIDLNRWRELRQEHPPQFYLDETDQRVHIGGRSFTLDEMPIKAYEMLVYLYHVGPQRYVSKAELYYRAYMKKETVPRSPGDTGYEPKKNYEGVVDTTIWRLRKIIEPDPKDPVLILTKRGVGLSLNVRW